MRAIVCAVTAAVVALSVTSSMAQQSPAAGKFDGVYSGSMKCFPAMTARLNGLTIKQSKFTFSFTYGATRRSCALQVNDDGSFGNQACDVPMSGKIVGDKFESHFKTQDAICDVTATRQKS